MTGAASAPGPPPRTTEPGGGILVGLRYAWGDPLIRTMLLVLAAINLTAIGPMVVGGAMLAEERLGGASSLGILFSAFGGGSLIGLLAAGATHRGATHRGATMFGATALIGVGLGALGFVPDLLGRDMSLVVFCSVALDPVSYAPAGALVGESLVLTFVAAGTLMLATALLSVSSRTERRFD